MTTARSYTVVFGFLLRQTNKELKDAKLGDGERCRMTSSAEHVTWITQ
jgi:hypothetical protein